MSGSPYKVITQKPLAIYVPSEPVALWQTGRKEYKMRNIIKSHKEIALDMNRSYAVIYEWLKGIDVAEAFTKQILGDKCMESLTLLAEKAINQKGFTVIDNKPHHIIIRPKDNNKVARNKKGNILYAMVDYELLERTPEQEIIVKKHKRTDYLKRQRDRFAIAIPNKFHPHLHHVNIFGIDYVYGNVESTKGRLWVIGKDPFLFDYFLPERWEQIPKTKISIYNDMYYTISKDNIHLAWKISKVGSRPDMDPFIKDEKKILEYGFNSPFEEVDIAVKLNRQGIPTIYPRAIYVRSNKTKTANNILEMTRYNSHKDLVSSDDVPILEKYHDYISIWGYWNGPDEKLAAKDGDYYEGINVLEAYKKGIITENKYLKLLRRAKDKLLRAGFEDLNFRGNHLLISLDSKNNLVRDNHGMPELRVCNFEFIKKIK